MDAVDAESAEAIKVEKIGRDAYIGVHMADGSLSGYGEQNHQHLPSASEDRDIGLH